MAPKVDQRYRVTSDPFAGAASPTLLAPTEDNPNPAPMQLWAIDDVVGKEAVVVGLVPAATDGAGDHDEDCVVVQWQDGDPSKPDATFGPNRLTPKLRTASVPASDFADHFEEA